MNYYFSKRIKNSSVAAIRPIVEAELLKEGFTVLTEINVQATMKARLNKDYLPHLILGACNPVYADKAISAEPSITTLLPCNVTIRETEDGSVEVAVINPKVALSVVNKPGLEGFADEVEEQLKRALSKVQ